MLKKTICSPGHLLTARPGGGGAHHLADQAVHAPHLPPLLPHQQDPGLGPGQRDRHGVQQGAAHGANKVTTHTPSLSDTKDK